MGKVERFKVNEDEVSWSNKLPGYKAVEFTAPFVLTAPWADPEIGFEGFHPEWNKLDGKVNRVSHNGEYDVNEEGRPLNIIGRTGISGRGVLGRWGPNHAADPIVTRWKRRENGEILKNQDSGKNVLEFVSIQRKDNGEWAIPGGMVDPGEKVSTAVKREFMEEALDSTGSAKENIEELQDMVESFFSKGIEVYKGYVDDPRNTDNAWMETVAFNFHDSTGSSVGQFPLHAGDDAANIRWMALDSNVSLYASHKNMLEIVVKRHDAHWNVREVSKWKLEKDRISVMPLKEKRRKYSCEDSFITLESLKPWCDSIPIDDKIEVDEEISKSLLEDFKLDGSIALADKVSLFTGDITCLEIDAIVNAANNSLLGGGGVDGAINRAAGPLLKEENRTHKGCPDGEARISGGYNLPAKYVISTVGPRGEKPDLLKMAYENCLEKMLENGLRTIAFPCISTGIFGYPNDKACEVALKTVRSFLEKNHQSVDRIIFCLFLDVDVELYKERMPIIFPNVC